MKKFLLAGLFALVALPAAAQDTAIAVKIPDPGVQIQIDHSGLNTDFYQLIVDVTGTGTGTVCALTETSRTGPNQAGLYTINFAIPGCLAQMKGTHTIAVEAANNDGGLSGPSPSLTVKVIIVPDKPGKPRIVIQ